MSICCLAGDSLRQGNYSVSAKSSEAAPGSPSPTPCPSAPASAPHPMLRCHCCTVTVTWETALTLVLIFSYCHPVGPEMSDSINTFRQTPDGGACWDLDCPLFPSAQHSRAEPEAPGLELLTCWVASHPGCQLADKGSLSVLRAWVHAATGKNARCDFLVSHRVLFQFSVLVYKTTPKLSGSKHHFVFLVAG